VSNAAVMASVFSTFDRGLSKLLQLELHSLDVICSLASRVQACRHDVRLRSWSSASIPVT